MRKSKKSAIMLAVIGLGVFSPMMSDTFGIGVFEVSMVEATKISSVGEVTAFAKDSNPTGYLLCDGRAVSRTEYAELFAEIGTKYGAGDGETTFNLPNLVDRFVEGSTEAGKYIEAGLPNVTSGGQVFETLRTAPSGWYGSVYYNNWGQTNTGWVGNCPTSKGDISIDASKENPVYGKSDTVQPESLTMRYFIKATKTADGGDGVIEAGNEETISGDTAYKELRPTDGNYVKESSTTAENLTSLDEQVKGNTDSIAQLGSDITAAEKRAKKEAAEKASAAEAAAKADAAQKVLDAETRAKQDATDKANQAEANAKEDAMNKANQAKQDAINTAASDATNKANAAQVAAAQDATNKANTAESNAKSYTDLVVDAAKTYAKTYTDEVAKGKATVSMDNINEAGKQVIRDLAKNEIKNSGIDTTGDIVVVNKPMETKDIHGKGDLEIDGKTHLHGNTEIGKNLIVYGNERIDGSLDVGGNSHIHGSQTVDGDSHVKGNSEFDKDVTVHGSETIDKNLHVKGDAETDGNSTVHGSQSVDGNFEVKGDSTLGDDKNKNVVDVNAKTNLHGDTIIGDSDKDKLTVNATSEFKADATFDNDVHIKGKFETGDDMAVSGDGSFGKDLYIAGTTNTGTLVSRGGAAIGGNTYIAGDAKMDGDIYGRSFNVDNERYIDKNGVNANGHKIRNVADGDVSPNSTDAVNGRQLYDVQQQIVGGVSGQVNRRINDLDNRLTNNINQIGAGAAAMANLHPLDYEHNDKLTVSAAVGNYKDQTALAAGVFFRPNAKTMVNFSGSLGNSENMVGIGVSAKMGKASEFAQMTEDQLRDEVSKVHDENKELKDELKKVKEQNVKLEKVVSGIDYAYKTLIEKFNAMAAELKALKGDA